MCQIHLTDNRSPLLTDAILRTQRRVEALERRRAEVWRRHEHDAGWKRRSVPSHPIVVEKLFVSCTLGRRPSRSLHASISADSDSDSARKRRALGKAAGRLRSAPLRRLCLAPRPDTPGGPWKVYMLSRRQPLPWSSSSPAVTHVHADLTDAAAAAKALAPLTDVTHIFYAA